jgi:transposase, IS30 family
LKNYGHRTSAERAQIKLLRKHGHGPAEIGRKLGRAKSTISRELQRAPLGEPYSGAAAQAAAAKLAAKARRPSLQTPERDTEIRTRLAQGWSPEQIA